MRARATRVGARFITAIGLVLLIGGVAPALGQSPTTESTEQGATPIDQMDLGGPPSVAASVSGNCAAGSEVAVHPRTQQDGEVANDVKAMPAKNRPTPDFLAPMFETGLGKNSAAIGAKTSSFDPRAGWKEVSAPRAPRTRRRT